MYGCVTILFDREAYTLQLLNKFKEKLSGIKSTQADDDDDDNDNEGGTSKEDANDEDLNTDKWMVRIFSSSQNKCTLNVPIDISIFVNFYSISKLVAHIEIREYG